jgi:hypothetical protein
MNNPRKKTHFVIALYWVAVLGCLVVQAGVDDDTNASLWVALFVLTLPWSLVPMYFTWAIIHSDISAGFIVGMVIVFAALNSFIMYRFARWIERRAERAGA